MTIYDIVFIQDKIKEAIMAYLLLFITLKRKVARVVILPLITHTLTNITCVRETNTVKNGIIMFRRRRNGCFEGIK